MSTDQKLDPCGCCEGAISPTPEEIANRPGLPAIRYRLGTYSSFREAMIQAVARDSLLRSWTARSDDDYGIALLDMWAYIGDILTFYQERIANESFLRTAILRESIIRIAAILDYRPDPGVAATSYLAFTLEKGKRANIPIGLRVQSVPAQNQKPQKFETVESVNTTAALNRVPVLPEPAVVSPLIATGVEALLDPQAAARIVAEVASGDAFVIFTEGATVVEEKEVAALRTQTEGVKLSWLPPLANSWGLSTRVFRFRRKLSVFGHNAPNSYMVASEDASAPSGMRWSFEDSRPATQWNISGSTISLDALYDDLKAETKLIIHVPGVTTRLVRIRSVAQAQDNTLPAFADTVTRITVYEALGSFDRRNVIIYELVEPEIDFWNLSFGSQISGNVITARLKDLSLGQLPVGRNVILADASGKTALVKVETVQNRDYDLDTVGDHLSITFTPALSGNFDARSTQLFGNVVRATHGETIANEVLGNGDAAAAFQSFRLKKKPVTFVPEKTAANGAANTLQVRVGGVLWQEQPTLFGHDADDQVFKTTIADDDTMTVQFGDGETGARLPSGRSNVVAAYRQGTGQAGNVNANSLTTLLDRPRGVKAVSNPDPAAGGAEPESMAAARGNAPNTVRTFGRIVSLRDFEDAAREFAGIAKARAAWELSGGEMAVRLVVAGDNGALVGGVVMQNLRQYLDARRDPNRRLLLQGFTRMAAVVRGVVRVDPRHVAANVQIAALGALRNYFAFENLDLGQAVHLSGIYAVLKNVPGVVAADIDEFTFKTIGSMTFAERRQRGIKFGPLLIPDAVQGHLLMRSSELAFIENAADAVVTVGVIVG